MQSLYWIFLLILHCIKVKGWNMILIINKYVLCLAYIWVPCHQVEILDLSAVKYLPLNITYHLLTIVYSSDYSGADKKNQSSASQAFVVGIHLWPVNSQHKWPVTRKIVPFHDVIMIFTANKKFTNSICCRGFLISHDITLHVLFHHWRHKCHNEKLEHVIMKSLEVGTPTLAESCNISYK